MPPGALEDAEEDAEAEGAEGTRGPQPRLAADSAELARAARRPLPILMRRNRRRSKAAVVPSPRQEPIA